MMVDGSCGSTFRDISIRLFFCFVLFLTLLAFYSLFCFNIFLVLIFFELLPTFVSLLKTAKQSSNEHKHTLIRKKKKKSLHIHLWQCGLEG